MLATVSATPQASRESAAKAPITCRVRHLELSNFEQRGSADVADNVRGALDTIDKNEEFIKMTLAVLMTPE
ncbi:hypothetical protein [Pseudomonas purpurea]|uniref:hypothetical protein n=1 Tax=Pseudomonas purpurea TaxID=3136737 RepID=UPI003262D4CB